MQYKPAVLFLLAALTAAPAFAGQTAADIAVPDTGFGSVGTATAVGTSVPPPELMREIVTRGYDQLKLKPDLLFGGWVGTAEKNTRQVKLHVSPNGNVREG
ncbi:MAG: hypothetical protein JWM77_3782 [Rhodospirillales bacterium]|nr:hypothetical protein [Rhodospirillales bacterium]